MLSNLEVEPLFISKKFPAKSWKISGKSPPKLANLLQQAYGTGGGDLNPPLACDWPDPKSFKISKKSLITRPLLA